jgi:hypothetical protein
MAESQTAYRLQFCECDVTHAVIAKSMAEQNIDQDEDFQIIE